MLISAELKGYGGVLRHLQIFLIFFRWDKTMLFNLVRYLKQIFWRWKEEGDF